jgi:hypothetical protein
MNTFVKIVFYANFLFWGGGFLIAFGQFVIYNGIGNIFEYIKIENAQTNVEIDSLLNDKTIHYIYMVKDKQYKSKQTVIIHYVPKYDFYETNIYYNKIFPYFSYVGNNRLKLRGEKTGMIISGFFFLFIFSIYKFADMDKWIGVYTRGEYKSSKPKG